MELPQVSRKDKTHDMTWTMKILSRDPYNTCCVTYNTSGIIPFILVASWRDTKNIGLLLYNWVAFHPLTPTNRSEMTTAQVFLINRSHQSLKLNDSCGCNTWNLIDLSPPPPTIGLIGRLQYDWYISLKSFWKKLRNHIKHWGLNPQKLLKINRNYLHQ